MLLLFFIILKIYYLAFEAGLKLIDIEIKLYILIKIDNSIFALF